MEQEIGYMETQLIKVKANLEFEKISSQALKELEKELFDLLRNHQSFLFFSRINLIVN